MNLGEKIVEMQPLTFLFRGLLFFVGSVLFFFAVWQIVESARILATHDSAIAEVTKSFIEGSPGARFQTYRIEATFTTERGKHRTEIRRAHASYDAGERITIYYQMETAYRSHLGGFWGLWFLPTLISFFASIFLFCGSIPNTKAQ